MKSFVGTVFGVILGMFVAAVLLMETGHMTVNTARPITTWLPGVYEIDEVSDPEVLFSEVAGYGFKVTGINIR